MAIEIVFAGNVVGFLFRFLREIAKIFGIYGKDSEGADVPFIIDMSVIPKKGRRELASEQ